MEWNDCLRGKVRKRRPNTEEAKALMGMAEKRLEYIGSVQDRKRFPSLVAEGYYEAIKELVTAMMSAQGYKSYSHECMVSFLSEFYGNISRDEMALIDQMRKIRNDINYRGFVLNFGYLESNEEGILSLIAKLKGILQGRLLNE